MRNAKIKGVIGLTLMLTITACSPSSAVDKNYGTGFMTVDQSTWAANYQTPYPFTVPSGEISCGWHAEFGREVYFEPVGFSADSYIGTPLNKAATESLKQANISANVPYSINKGADLSDAIKIGLQVCDELRDKLKNG